MMIRFSRISKRIVLAVVLLSLFSNKGYGCPCGCGSVSTETLFPSDTAKISLGYLTTNDRRRYDIQGNETESIDAEESELKFNGTLRLTDEASVGVGLATAFIEIGGETRQVLLEPVVYGNYTVNQYDFTIPYLPSLTLTLSYSPEEDEDLVAHRGYAYSQVKSSSWWTIGEHNLGLSLAVRRNFASKNDFNPSREVDFGYLYDGNLGYTFIKVPYGQVGFDYGYALNTKSSVGGELQPGTNKRYDPLSLFLGFRIAPKTNMRLEYVKNSVFIAQNLIQREKFGLIVAQTF